MLPSIAVAGAGPAGLLIALLLGRRNLDVTLFEAAEKAPEWTPRSHAIGVRERGQQALKKAGILDAVQKTATVRDKRIIHTADGDSVTMLPFQSLGSSRPQIVAALTEQLLTEGRVRLVRGTSVSDVKASLSSDLLRLTLTDGSESSFTHVVGADGKWSAVRMAAENWERLQESSTLSSCIRFERSWGVQIDKIVRPDEWDEKAVHVWKPKVNPEGMYGLTTPYQWYVFNITRMLGRNSAAPSMAGSSCGVVRLGALPFRAGLQELGAGSFRSPAPRAARTCEAHPPARHRRRANAPPVLVARPYGPIRCPRWPGCACRRRGPRHDTFPRRGLQLRPRKCRRT